MPRRFVLIYILVALALVGAVGAPTVVLAEGDTQTAAQGGVWYTVRPGDNVTAIGRRFGVPPAAIITANGLKPPYTIYPNQQLWIPTTPPAGFIYHRVVTGDTVSGLARRYGVSQQAIIAANGLKPPYTIYVGQTLLIPIGQPPPPPPPPCQSTYVVQPGDTLSSIGVRFGVPWPNIAAANGIQSPYIIYPGQTLVIPCGQPTPPPPAPRIIIYSPPPGATVFSPVLVSGVGLASFEQTLVVQVFNAAGQLVGQAPVIVQGELGQQGSYSVAVPFNIPPGIQNGRIEVLDISPADGRVVARAVQQVRLQR